MSENRSDQKQFSDVLESIDQHAGRMPEKVTADAGYFSAPNIVGAQNHGIDAYIGVYVKIQKGGLKGENKSQLGPWSIKRVYWIRRTDS